MASTRRDVWSLGTVAKPWHPALLAYAKAVRTMQTRPLADPTSWAYQAAIHGLANTPPPPGAPWNQCQHATWYFLPWHRMYLYQFERILRAEVVAGGGPATWALPYWNYEGAGSSNQLPPAFRQSTLPDGTPNPLRVSRRSGINTGLGLPPSVTSSAAAAAKTFFTTPSGGAPVGFGGPQTGFAHFGPAPGELENQPHNIIHVAVGGPTGFMSNPDTAALDPIFWLHHANIDRLWETWRLSGGANASTLTWRRRRFKLRDSNKALVQMRVGDVLDATAQLDYGYDALPAIAAAPGQGAAVTPRPKPVMVGRTTGRVRLARDGGSMSVPLGPLPRDRPAALRATPPRYHLELSGIEGTVNPGVVYGVYVNLPPGAGAGERERHRAGVFSLFGIEHSTSAGSSTPQKLRYSFDISDLVADLRARGDLTVIQVSIVPDEDLPDEPPAAAAASAPVEIGTIAVLTS